MSRLSEMIKELCPDGVEYKKLGEIAEIIRGNGLQKSDFVDSGVGCIHYGQIYTKYGAFADKTITYVTPELAKTLKTVSTGDLVVAITSENVEDVCKCVAWLGGDDIVTGGHAAIVKHKQNPKYLSYIFQTVEFFRQKRKYVIGTKVIEMSPKKLAEISIPVPPLAIQNEIVKLLDNFTELTAELTAELQLRKKQYEWYCGSLIGGATFPKRKISDIATFRYGYTTSAATSGDARYIRITDITDDGKLNPLDAKYTCISTENKEYLLKRDDLVMARTGATYGKTLCYNMDTPAIYASFLIKIQVDETQMLPRFYWHFTRTPEYWGQANRLVTKGGQPQFNTGAIGRIVIPIPPLETQAKIVSILDRFDTLCHDLTQGLPAEIAARKKQYEYYREKLLTFPRKGTSARRAR